MIVIVINTSMCIRGFILKGSSTKCPNNQFNFLSNQVLWRLPNCDIINLTDVFICIFFLSAQLVLIPADFSFWYLFFFNLNHPIVQPHLMCIVI